MDEQEKLREKCRLATICIGILNCLEKCVSALRTGFLDDHDFYKNKQTINRLHKEVLEVDTTIVEQLDNDPHAEPEEP